MTTEHVVEDAQTGAGAANELHLKNVRKRFGGRTVVDVPDLTLGTHGISGLIGPNGAGKTTLMALIAGTHSLDRGRISYTAPNGEEFDLTTLRVEQISRLGIVKTNQLLQDFETLSIVDSMLLSLASDREERFYRVLKDKEFMERTRERLAYYLDYFGFGKPKGLALSAGEKKLLDIVRCLLVDPDLLLMDEPTAGLSEEDTRRVMEFVKSRTDAGDFSAVVIEHDLEVIWGWCEHVYFMAEGQLLVEGTAEQLLNDRRVAEKYLGSDRA